MRVSPLSSVLHRYLDDVFVSRASSRLSRAGPVECGWGWRQDCHSVRHPLCLVFSSLFLLSSLCSAFLLSFFPLLSFFSFPFPFSICLFAACLDLSLSLSAVRVFLLPSKPTSLCISLRFLFPLTLLFFPSLPLLPLLPSLSLWPS